MIKKSFLRLNNIQKNFGNVKVLKNISIEIEKGEIVCLVGSSGCGKTTLLNIISGIIKPSQGNIIYTGENISYIFQEDRLLPWYDVYHNIKIVNKNCTHKKCMQLINGVGLKGFEGFYPDQLSGGMRQRCSIARAFNYNADLLLMDEPFKALDYNLRIEMIRKLLFLWQTMKKTIIFVTHDIDEALFTGDRIFSFSSSSAGILREFVIKTNKIERKLNDPKFVLIRNNIIESICNNAIK